MLLVEPQVDETALDGMHSLAPETLARFAHDLRVLQEAGAELCGGCCGCRPEHLMAVEVVLSTTSFTPG